METSQHSIEVAPDLRRFRTVDERRQLRAAIRMLLTWIALVVVVLVAPWTVLRLGASLGLGLAATTLFLTGHDCAHRSFTGNPGVDRRLGVLVMLPSFQPFAVWAREHVTVHHRWPNLVGHDFVWQPVSPTRYRSAGPLQRLVWRTDRSTLGLLTYYVREIWWKRQFRASARRQLSRRELNGVLLVVVHAVLLLLAVLAAATVGSASSGATVRAAGEGVLLVVVVPFAVTMWFQGFGTFFNHTHPSIPWFDDVETWRAHADQATTALLLRFRRLPGFFLGNVFDHPAHHVDPRVPLCRLDEAQAFMSDSVSEPLVTATWTLAHHRSTMRTCRLFDFERHRWTDFDGRPTTQPLVTSEPAGPTGGQPRTAANEATRARPMKSTLASPTT